MLIISNLYIFCISGFVLLLSGCSVLNPSQVPVSDCGPLKTPCEEICQPETDPIAACSVEGQLLAAAKSIDRSLNVLASAQEAESPPVLQTLPLVSPEGGMGNTADIDWAGPIGPLIEKIARMTDYRVKILGNEPPIPIIVNITARRTVIAEILQNASYQAGRRAHILVFPANRVIELRYLST